MELCFRLEKSPQFIFEYLTDMDKFVTVHPVITKMDRVDDEKYLVHETLKLLFVPISFTYPVIVQNNDKDKSIFMKAEVMKLAKIEMTFSLTTDGDITEVKEQIQFSSFLPIQPLMRRIFRNQHAQLFKNIALKVE